MLFALSLLLSLNNWLSLPSASGQSVCDCEKIIKEKKCDNPDCITICGLQDVLNSAGQKLYAKCMEKITKSGFKKKVKFPAEERSRGSVKGYLQTQGRKVQKINKKNNKILKRHCEDCDFISTVSTEIKPGQAEEKCDKYIKTTNFKLWRKATDKDSSLCNNTEELDGKTKTLCFQGYRFTSCCPKEYLKTHSFKSKIKLRQGKTCRKVDIDRLDRKKSAYISKTLGNDKLWDDCPRGCSFHIFDDSTFSKED